MELIQKKLSNNTKFVFGGEKLQYTLKDNTGSQSFAVEYSSIPSELSEFIEQNVWYRNVGIAWLIISGFQMAHWYSELGTLKVSLWLLLGIVFFAIYMLAKTEYSILNTDNGRIFIIKDVKHDQILGEIHSRKRGQLLSWYGDINYSNDPNNELAKFNWLLDQGAITESERSEMENKLRLYHEESVRDMNPAPDKLIN